MAREVPELVSLMMADGVSLRESDTGKWYGRCPFHGDRNPSLTVSLNPWGYWTFKCWASFCDVSGGKQKYLELTGRPPDTRAERKTRRERSIYDRPSRELLALAAQHYNEMLLEYPEATEYLRARGVDPEAAQRWGVGYAPGNTLYRLLRDRMESAELERCVLVKAARKEDRLTRRIIFPNYGDDDQGGWHTGRAIDPDATLKYMSMPGKRPALISLKPERDARPNEPLIVTEGPMDLLATLAARLRGAATAGNPNPISLPGAIGRKARGTLFIMPDRDEGGDGWAEKVEEAARTAGRPYLIVNLPPTIDDPAESLKVRRTLPRQIYAAAIRRATWEEENRQRKRTTDQVPQTTKTCSGEEREPQEKELETMAHMTGAKVMFFGNLTEDARILGDNPDRPMAGIRVACNYRRYSREAREYEDATAYFGCTAFGASAKMALDLRRGDMVYIEGNLQPTEREGNDGKVRQYLDVQVSDIHNRIQWAGRRSGGRDEDDRRDDRRGSRDDRGRDSRGRDDRDDRGRDRDDRDRDDRGGSRGREDRSENRDREDRRENRSRDNDDDRRENRGGGDRGDFNADDTANVDDLPF